VRFLWPG